MDDVVEVVGIDVCEDVVNNVVAKMLKPSLRMVMIM